MQTCTPVQALGDGVGPRADSDMHQGPVPEGHPVRACCTSVPHTSTPHSLQPPFLQVPSNLSSLSVAADVHTPHVAQDSTILQALVEGSGPHLDRPDLMPLGSPSASWNQHSLQPLSPLLPVPSGLNEVAEYQATAHDNKAAWESVELQHLDNAMHRRPLLEGSCGGSCNLLNVPPSSPSLQVPSGLSEVAEFQAAAQSSRSYSPMSSEGLEEQTIPPL